MYFAALQFPQGPREKKYPSYFVDEISFFCGGGFILKLKAQNKAFQNFKNFVNIC